MGCCGDREKAITVSEEQKWDYITLSDFKSTSCLAPFSYAWLWMLVLFSIAVYAADAFTAVNLLAFNKWSSQVKPKVSFDIAKWIFAVCIIVSYVFLIYRWIQAWRVIRSGSVAESYLEPLAAIFQSMRVTKEGQGFRRFLVFAELTKSRKGVDYIALFVYFQFKSALLIIVAQGPRTAINAMTLWAVMQAQIIPVGDHAATNDRSSFEQFFMNIDTLIETGNKQETVIYFTMLFSLVIWVIGALALLFSIIFYVFFLWHYIPSSDGNLTKYCRRKIENRLARIVNKKVRKAIEKQDAKRRREEQMAGKKGDGASAHRAPTLPKLGGADDDTASIFSQSTVTTLPPYSVNGLARTNTSSTVATLPPYSANGLARTNTSSTTMTARSAAMRQPSLPSLDERPSPTRTDTNLSTISYASNAPLLSQAESMGRSSPVPPMPTLDRNADYFGGPPNRPMPPGALPGRPYSPMSQDRASPQPLRGPLPPVQTAFPNGRNSPAPQLVSPLANNSGYPNRGPGPARFGDTSFSPYDNRAPARGPSYELSPVEMTPSDNAPQQYSANFNTSNEYMPPQLPNALRSGSPAQASSMNNNFTSPPSSRAGTAPPGNPRAGLPATLQSAIQRREASQPLPRGPNAYIPGQRSATAPLQQPSWGQRPTPRSNTTTPGPQGYNNGY
ncbi:hypothetical protein K491DRAFT_610116 [Lophiostoma macrostomum CBS 122681]|uniref:Pheromone-regulated membrane protein n=1 Tax=Lophiostoma macrostomum CBS 122681 TaxID=1314788 RepID=A0A6A6SS08_9PLEO|nr:hypothetical protein K491DRAFT_610116 [Lophiostoma macrostomum CBS 122681]